MLLKIRTLGKTFCTARDGAHEGLLLSVDPKVVEKVASLSELLATVLVLALHNSSNPFGALVFISQNFIMGSIWNMLGFADPMECFVFLDPVLFRHYFSDFQSRLLQLLLVVLIRDLIRVRETLEAEVKTHLV